MADIDDLEKIADPLERAREIGRRMALIPLAHARLRELRQAAVVELKAKGMSYADIGRELGLHRNRVQQILEGRSAGGGHNRAKSEGETPE